MHVYCHVRGKVHTNMERTLACTKSQTYLVSKVFTRGTHMWKLLIIQANGSKVVSAWILIFKTQRIYPQKPGAPILRFRCITTHGKQRAGYTLSKVIFLDKCWEITRFNEVETGSRKMYLQKHHYNNDEQMKLLFLQMNTYHSNHTSPPTSKSSWGQLI